MSERVNQIGFSQRIQLDWLERTSNLVLAGTTRTDIISSLQELLRDKVSIGGSAERGNREKIITILLKIWLRPPAEAKSLHATGLELLRNLPAKDHIAVHWGMVMCVYPFWGGVAVQVGRLLRLQGSAAAAHVQRRVREQYGERETVSRAARRILRCFADWGTLQETAERGIYGPCHLNSVEDSSLISWLVEATLHTKKNRSAPLGEILDDPALFPFRLKPIRSDALLTGSANLEILRHGMDEELVILRKQKAPSSDPVFPTEGSTTTRSDGKSNG